MWRRNPQTFQGTFPKAAPRGIGKMPVWVNEALPKPVALPGRGFPACKEWPLEVYLVQLADAGEAR
jgi:hypothetical protein